MSSKIFKIFCFCLCSLGILVGGNNVLAAPDLVVADIYNYENNCNIIMVKVCNQGSSMSASFRVSLKIGDGPTILNDPIDNSVIIDSSVPIKTPCVSVAMGSIGYNSVSTATAVADAIVAGQDAVAESNENNNSLTKEIVGCGVSRNGQCGVSNGQTFPNIFMENLCTQGKVTIPVDSGSGTWLWTCNGINGGTNASCYAYKAGAPINGQCGSQNNPSGNGVVRDSLTSSSPNLCAAGNVSNFQIFNGGDGDAYWWLCDGLNGGNGSNWCLVHIKANGSCGTSNGGTFSSAPTTNLCSAGTASSVTTNSTTYTWTCAGAYGGTTASCSANRTVNGSCGTSNGQSFYVPPTTNLCNAGNASSVTTNSTQFTWTCSGINGGSTASCSSNQLTRSRPCLKYGDINQSGAINYYDLILAFEQLENLALDLIDVNGSGSGDFNDIVDIQNYVNGTISTFSVCSKIVNGSCGTANGKTYLYSASSYGSDTQCASGTSTNTAFPAAGGSVSWVCNGAYGGTNSGTCSASRYASAPVNGSCGTANGKTYLYSASSYGSDTQCASGTSTNTAFPAAGGSVSWVCNGAYGGTNSGTCSASRYASAPVNGSCGTANGHGYYATSEIDTAAERCSAGTFTSFTNNGSSWSWACNGSNGGTNA
ncbi:MAG TPA: hypothetical protein PLG37_01500, partial [Candidatus Pacearchaeota archaeon]|nr:hypothetical protein [Candidatus Pacearchaeota archaeon]